MRTKKLSQFVGRTDLCISLALAAYGFSIAVWLLRSGVRVTQEDGYYYYKIAEEMAHGAGSTFDGFHATNGYHPLWLLCLTVIFRIAPTSSAAVTLGVLLQGLFMAACGALVYRTARLAIGRPGAALSGLVWLALTYRQALSGLEFGLHALCLSAAAYIYLGRLHKLSNSPVSAYGALGLLLGMAFLARLDMLLLAGIAAVLLCLREQRSGWTRDSLHRMTAFSLPIAALCLSYMVINQKFFGNPWPISGVVKREWSVLLLVQDPIYQAHGWLAAKAVHLLWPLYGFKAGYPVAVGGYIAPLLLLICANLRLEPGGQTQFLRGLLPFAVYSVAQVVVTALLYHGDLSEKPWYYVVQPWVTALVVGLIFQRLADFRVERKQSSVALATAVGAALLMFWCIVPVATLRTLRRWEALSRTGGDHAELVEAAQWINANLPPDAVVGAWNAGTIGFLSGRRVINLDGLVNSWNYEQIERHDLCGYFRKTGITYLVDAFENGKVVTYAQGSTNYLPCVGKWVRIWSDDRPDSSWRMEAYRLSAHGR